jgi:sortase A
MPRVAAALLLALAGLLLFGQGAYIHAKALLAQVLLERAFNETIATGHATNRGPGPIPGRSRASR